MTFRDEADEDWLRYSPPKGDAVPDVPLTDVVAEEKIISRFAADIDGECMPVTAPSGVRVYAKMSSAELSKSREKLMTWRPLRGSSENVR